MKFPLVVAAFLLIPALAQAYQVDLARPDRDQPGDNSFVVTGSNTGLGLLSDALTHHLTQVLSAMTPGTDDPTIRDVQWYVNDSGIQLSFQKQEFFFWSTVTISGSTSLTQFTCPAPSQQGWEIRFNTNDPQQSQEIQDYVQAIEIRACGRAFSQAGTPALEVTVQRLLDTGPSYQDWIGLLLGDFMRSAGSALHQTLQSLQ